MAVSMKNSITQEQVKHKVFYDGKTGVFTSRNRTLRYMNDIVLGTEATGGYLTIGVGNYSYLAHRLAWIYSYGEHPKGMIDHINGDRKDNRIENLRDVTPAENRMNLRSASKNNKCGYLGVSYCKVTGKWTAAIGVNKKHIVIGKYETPEAAHHAYLLKKREVHSTCTI